MPLTLDDLLALAFARGPGLEANRLITEERDRTREAQGVAINYEVMLDGRGWQHLREVVAPRLALYLREKRMGVAACEPVFISFFRGEQLYMVRAADFFEHYRLREGLSREAFDALASTWERTGRPVAGALPAGPAPGQVDLPAQVGSVMVVGMAGPEADPDLLERITAGRAGGVILFARNILSPAQVARLNATLRQAAPEGRAIFLAVDQEGGRVQRLRAPMTVWPPMARLGQVDDPGLTQEVGRAMGRDLALLGFNLDFAPVLDVVQSQDNTVIGDRSFGADPALVARHGLAFARGLMQGGVLPCGKHFPGHGGPVADSHVALPVERRARAELAQLDWVPFEAFIQAGMPMLMTAHVVFEALDDRRQGSLSKAINTDLLRGELGFAGVLVSDDLEMAAISGTRSPGEAALRALLSGVDLLLMCEGAERQLQALDFVVQQAENNEEVRVRVQEAAARVDALRQRIQAPPEVDPESAEEQVLDGVHRKVLARLS